MKRITNIFICLSLTLTINFLCTGFVKAQTNEQEAPKSEQSEKVSYEDLERYNSEAFDKDTVYNEETN